MRRIFLATAFLAITLVIPALAKDKYGKVYTGLHDESNVQVVVSCFGVMEQTGPISAGLDCAGNFQIGGAYADTTIIRSTISRELAVAFVDDLLAMDFFGQPAEYRARWGGIGSTEDGKVALTSTDAMDSGSFRITLYLGPNEHTVSLGFSAPGAPEALKDWEQRFRALINEQAGWKILRSDRGVNMNEAHFILYVADQEKSTKFYGHVFGKAPSLNVPGMTQFDLPGGATLGLMPITSIKRLLGDTLPDPTPSTPRSELYLLVGDPSAYHQRAIDAGAVELSPVSPRDWGDNAGYSLDPDSHVLSFATPSKRP